MVRRRELVSGGIVAGLATLTASGAEVAPAFDDEKIAHAAVRARAELIEGAAVVGAQRIGGVWSIDTESGRGVHRTFKARALVAADRDGAV